MNVYVVIGSAAGLVVGRIIWSKVRHHFFPIEPSAPDEERYDCPIHGTGEGADCPRC